MVMMLYKIWELEENEAISEIVGVPFETLNTLQKYYQSQFNICLYKGANVFRKLKFMTKLHLNKAYYNIIYSKSKFNHNIRVYSSQ